MCAAENGAALKIFAGKAVASGSVPTGKADFSQCETVLRFDKTAGIVIQCGDGNYAVSELQRQGKNAAKAKDFMNGARGFIGTVLGAADSKN
ncbi:MAG: hypothetical protein ACTTKL_11630 [Treponema sp.]